MVREKKTIELDVKQNFPQDHFFSLSNEKESLMQGNCGFGLRESAN